jgi:hypothetical protein
MAEAYSAIVASPTKGCGRGTAYLLFPNGIVVKEKPWEHAAAAFHGVDSFPRCTLRVLPSPSDSKPRFWLQSQPSTSFSKTQGSIFRFDLDTFPGRPPRSCPSRQRSYGELLGGVLFQIHSVQCASDAIRNALAIAICIAASAVNCTGIRDRYSKLGAPPKKLGHFSPKTLVASPLLTRRVGEVVRLTSGEVGGPGREI